MIVCYIIHFQNGLFVIAAERQRAFLDTFWFTIFDTFWFLQSPLNRVFSAIYVLSRSQSWVCLYVCRNSGSIIKLPGCLLNEGAGHKQDFVLRTHRPSAIAACSVLSRSQGFSRMQFISFTRTNSGKYGSISFNEYTSDNLFSVQSRGKQCALMSLLAV